MLISMKHYHQPKWWKGELTGLKSDMTGLSFTDLDLRQILHK